MINNSDKQKEPGKMKILTGEYNLVGRPSLVEHFECIQTGADMAKRYKSMIAELQPPLLMDMLCSSIGIYLEGRAEAGRFTNVYLSDLPSFFYRINGDDRIEYCRNCENVLELIKRVSIACYDYAIDCENDEKSKAVFDAAFLNAVKEYIAK